LAGRLVERYGCGNAWKIQFARPWRNKTAGGCARKVATTLQECMNIAMVKAAWA
jgi:hypothetical protein